MSEYIDREEAIKVLCDACGNAACPLGWIPRCSYHERMQAIPAADVVKVGRCRDCEHFEQDHWEVVDYLPMIVAHEICTRWGGGCKTSEDGYCSLWEGKKGQSNGNDGS